MTDQASYLKNYLGLTRIFPALPYGKTSFLDNILTID